MIESAQLWISLAKMIEIAQTQLPTPKCSNLCVIGMTSIVFLLFNSFWKLSRFQSHFSFACPSLLQCTQITSFIFASMGFSNL
jgi:hypothetical protein